MVNIDTASFAAIVRNRVTKFEFYTDEKLTFLKGTWHLKG